jgi:hypothetical protein
MPDVGKLRHWLIANAMSSRPAPKPVQHPVKQAAPQPDNAWSEAVAPVAPTPPASPGPRTFADMIKARLQR